jgi:SpoVK/Ycf46/Vps4 family AAA+-type ATPase
MKDWGMGNRLKKGYRVLFHGPPGTGKTLTASLLGKYTGRDVYKIDLSMVVSKYIGETEKNLENLFAKAETKNWILFFDEADALFGKRTSVRDAHDKYANQEVSYLLQRIEDFDGLVILASNMKNNIDDAFIRRFNSIIRFPLPAEEDRATIWKKSFPQDIDFNNRIDVPEVVKKFELTGGNIINVVQYACLKALEKKCKEIYLDDVLSGIKREMHKEGKPFSSNGK